MTVMPVKQSVCALQLLKNHTREWVDRRWNVVTCLDCLRYNPKARK